jgi:hypothetical protein
MKYNISSSLKTTLLAALPCLALSLFAVSCSDDDSAVVQEKTTKGKTISFTSAAPKITDYTTRIGLDVDRIPSSGNDPEPEIWLDGDALAFNFVKYGQQTGRVIKFTVSTAGAAYRWTTDEVLDLDDGLYEVYVLGPNLPTTFQGGALSGTTIDLRGQSQPENVESYKNLTDYYYQHAFTVLRLEDNAITWGSTHLTFTSLTSLLRYRITNYLSTPIEVVKINISVDSPNSQFYTRGAFDPSAVSSIVPTVPSVSTLGLTTNGELAPYDSQIALEEQQLNAYMTLIPTEGYASPTNFTVTVYFYIGNALHKRINTYDSFSGLGNNGRFPAGSRFLFGIGIRNDQYVEAEESELADIVEDELPGGDDSPGVFGADVSGITNGGKWSSTPSVGNNALSGAPSSGTWRN